MGSYGDGPSRQADPNNAMRSGKDQPQTLKILMLHGYAQSGSIFRSKTAALRKHLEKALSPKKAAALGGQARDDASYNGGVELVYATAPSKLSGADIPNFELRVVLSTKGASASSPEPQEDASLDTDQEVDLDAWGWWRKDPTTGEYIGLEAGLDALASILKTQGPFAGVIGFSQGATVAAMLASLLEPERKKAFERRKKELGDVGMEGMEFPASFLATDTIDPTKVRPTDSEPTSDEDTNNNPRTGHGEDKPPAIIHPPLKFVLAYSGFMTPQAQYSAFYDPPIATPVLHFIGKLDSVVEEKRSLELVGVCRDSSGTNRLGRAAGSKHDGGGFNGGWGAAGIHASTSASGARPTGEHTSVVYHPSGHFVPSTRPFLDAVVDFIKETLAS